MNFLRLFLTAVPEASEPVEAAQPSGGIADAITGLVDGMDLLMLVLLIGFGIYALYSVFRLNKEQILFPNKILYPGECKPEECADEGGFIDFIIPRAAILGGFLLLMGIFLGLNCFLFKVEALWMDILMMALPIGVFAWYIFAQRKAAKLFW